MARKNKEAAEEVLGTPEGATEVPEKQEPDPVAVADAQALVAQKEGELKAAKEALKALVGSSGVRRGPVGVGAFIKDCIKASMDNAAILAEVAEKFPANHTNTNCINWYRNALKQWPDGKRPSKKQVVEQAAVLDDPVPIEDDEAAE